MDGILLKFPKCLSPGVTVTSVVNFPRSLGIFVRDLVGKRLEFRVSRFDAPNFQVCQDNANEVTRGYKYCNPVDVYVRHGMHIHV